MRASIKSIPAKAGIHVPVSRFFWIPAFAGMLLWAGTGAAQDIVSQTPPECRLLPDHKPDAGVAYQPGVDARGRAVVPADLNAAPIGNLARETIVVPMSVDLARRIPNAPQGLELQGSLGYLEIHPDGRVAYDGQDWTRQVHILCGNAQGLADGQTAQDVIKSPEVLAPQDGAIHHNEIK